MNNFSSSAAGLHELQQGTHGSAFYAATPQERLSNYTARSSVLHRAMERYDDDVIQLVFDVICQVELPGLAVVHRTERPAAVSFVGTSSSTPIC